MECKTKNSRVSEPHDVRIITFNLLAQEAVNDVFFPLVKKHYLEFNARCEKAKKLLASWMKVNFIICLQEVSLQWQKELQPFFEQCEYGFVSQSYAGGKMGVGIAYPMKHFDLLESDEFMCGSFVEGVLRSIKHAHKSTSPNDSANNPGEHIDINPIIDELDDASSSKNILLTLLLDCKNRGRLVGKQLIVSTYHMPCKYRSKYYLVSHIHAMKVHLKEVQKTWLKTVSNISAVVIAGDFNITPKSGEYKFLTGEPYSIEEIKTQTSNGEPIDFLLTLDKVYVTAGFDLRDGIKTKSVHKSLHGIEPTFTNVSLKADLKFVDCLDYVLINDSTKIRSCTVGLTVENPLSTPYPNGLCSSDHLPLSASLIIV